MINRRAFCALLASASTSTVALSPGVSFAGGISEAVAAVSDADFIAIGERHDNPDHHRLQAELVAALSPAGLAFEMVPRALEEAANVVRASDGSISDLRDALKWAESGWPDWSHYAPIFEAAPEAYIAGGGLSKAELGAVYAGGANGIGETLAARYGLTEPLPDAIRAEMLDEQYLAHCEMMGRDKLGAMVEVQRAWDAAYAEAWWRAGQKGGGRSILICGNAHARLDRGAPAYLSRAFPSAKVASIGMLEDGDDEADAIYSVTMFAPAPEREDPCERMRAAMEKKG